MTANTVSANPVPDAAIRCADENGAEDAVDFETFARTMSNFASTVCVVAASDGASHVGRTVTAALSLSAQPPSLLVSITNGSDLAAMINRTGGFSVSLLANDQQAVGDAFAGIGPVESRFKAGQWSAWSSGQPRLEDGVASIDCRLAGSIVMDTHTLYAGILVASRTNDAKSPLLWHRRGYALLEGS